MCHTLRSGSVLCKCYVSLDNSPPSDLSLIQQEVDALEELSRQLFLETVDLQSTKVTLLAHTQFLTCRVYSSGLWLSGS